jgi:hypothetical protein
MIKKTKLLFLFVPTLLLFISIQVKAQVARDLVLFEVFTSTTCYYCPGAAMGVDELVANGQEVAVINYHSDDNFTNTAGVYRANYYNVSGTPTAKIDGVYTKIGGSHTQSMYSSYLSYYNMRTNVESDFNITISGTSAGQTAYNVEVTIENVGNYQADDIKMYGVVIESDISQYWQGQSVLNFVERMMLPSQQGEILDFSGSSTAEVGLDFTLEPEWVSENASLVVFIQDHSSKEILQATQRELSSFTSDNQYDLSLSSLRNVTETNCSGTLNPIIDVVNFGQLPVNSFMVSCTINNETFSYEWSGDDIATLETISYELPTMSFEVAETNTIEIEITAPNGEPDQFTSNNAANQIFSEAETTTRTGTLLLRTDNNPQETTWTITNSAGEIIHQGGPYEDPASFVEYNTVLTLDADDCYTFTAYDSGGDGLTDGDGMITFKTSDDIIVMHIYSEDFGYERCGQFHAVSGVAVDEVSDETGVSLYPNPAVETVHIAITGTPGQIKIYDLYGQLVYEANDQSFVELATDRFQKGLYMVKVTQGRQETVQKFMIK